MARSDLLSGIGMVDMNGGEIFDEYPCETTRRPPILMLGATGEDIYAGLLLAPQAESNTRLEVACVRRAKVKWRHTARDAAASNYRFVSLRKAEADGQKNLIITNRL